MPALRHPASLSGASGHLIALDHRDGSVEIGKHSGGQQTAHACPKNYYVFTNFCHGDLPTSEYRERTAQFKPSRAIGQLRTSKATGACSASRRRALGLVLVGPRETAALREEREHHVVELHGV